MDTKNKKERAKRLSQAYNYLIMNRLIRNQRELAAKMGTPPPNLSTAMTHSATKSYAQRFCIATDYIFNVDWLTDGTGDMLSGSTTSITHTNNGIQVDNNNGSISQTNYNGSTPNSSNQSAMVPVVPPKISQQPGANVWAYMQENDTREEPRVKQFSKYHLYHNMLSDAMSPRLKAGDTIALRRIDKSSIIVNGDVYCIDIRESGFTIREITRVKEGYMLHAVNERYGDFFVPEEEVLDIYKVVGAIITHI